ncbi:MAG TPA: hypothetical protein VFI12_10860, partial [Thermomicrobiales bacterium]|nr:hypothetical protein [Thermomicrobiales bacterium]
RGLASIHVPRRAMRLARTVGLAVIIALTLANIVWAVQDWHLHDMNVYWTAGEMFRNTGNPYTLAPGVDDNSVYRYAPWFALVWMPFTELPRLAVNVLWSAVLIVTSFTAVWPVLRAGGRTALPFAILMFGIFFGMAAGGNVHGLMIAWLAFGVERRSGPIWIALAASLKAVPILYVLVYAGRGEWRKVVEAVALTAILVAPMLLFDRPAMTSDFGISNSLAQIHPAIFWGSAAASVLVAVWVAFRLRLYGWLATGAAAYFCLPRVFLYDVTFILPGIAESITAARRVHGHPDPRG